MSNERLVKFGIRTKYTELETKPVSKQSRSQVFGFLIGINDVVAGSTFTDDIDDQGTFNNTLDNVNIANNYAYDELGNLTRNTQKEIAEIKWTVYGKVQEVIRTNGSSKKNLKFEYNANGQRTAKHVYSSSDVFEHSDYYVYDASGNLMSVYRKFSDANEQVLSYSLTERPMYGSSRLGVDKTTIEFIGYTPPTNGLTNHVVGLKQYEGSNHLGNVLTTFSDKKMPVDANSDGIIDYSTANITSSTDYYPFGVTMKARDFTSNVSRFGFNGKEKDEETETMDFGTRLLDGDLGLWLACDPLAGKYPSFSPYNYCANNPILFVDYDGKDFGIRVVESDKGNTITFVANVYTVAGDKNAVIEAKKFWEGQNGKYAYIDEATGKEYAINFEINVKVVDKIGSFKDQIQDADNKAFYDKIGGNSIISLPDVEFEKFNPRLGKIDLGAVEGCRRGRIRDHKKYTSTMYHELGHFFGILEWVKGIMYQGADLRTNELTVGTVQNIFQSADINVGSFSDGDAPSEAGRDEYRKKREAGESKVTVKNLGGAEKITGGKIIKK